jgi:hypothetical protein
MSITPNASWTDASSSGPPCSGSIPITGQLLDRLAGVVVSDPGVAGLGGGFGGPLVELCEVEVEHLGGRYAPERVPLAVLLAATLLDGEDFFRRAP